MSIKDYKFFATITVKTRFQLRYIYDNLKYREKYFIYRGQTNSEWDISPRIERKTDFSLDQLEEYEGFVFDFIDKNPAYTGLSDIEKLAKIQHYGGETRFVDFTHTFRNALFFALYDPDKKYQNKDFTVWLVLRGDSLDPKLNMVPLYRLNKDGLNRDYHEELERSNLFDYLNYQEYSWSDINEEIDLLMEGYPEELRDYTIAGLDIFSEEVNRFLRENSERNGFRTISLDDIEIQIKVEESERIEFVKSKYPENLRMMAQQGLFLFSLNSVHTFMENLCFGEDFKFSPNEHKYCKIMDVVSNGANRQRAVIKIIFKSSLREYTERFLKEIGITSKSLFPYEEEVKSTEEFFQSIYDKYLKTKKQS